MKQTVLRRREILMESLGGTSTLDAALLGALLGVFAQLIRQVPGVLMGLGASTAPWVMVGFVLAVSASRRARKTPVAIVISIVTVAAYLYAWLLLFHLLFVLKEDVPVVDGWRLVLPWLIAAVVGCPILGLVAALCHRHGVLGDVCLATPMAWALPEIFQSSPYGWPVIVAIELPVAVLAVLIIRSEMSQRVVRMDTLILAAAVLGAFGILVYPIVRNLIPSG